MTICHFLLIIAYEVSKLINRFFLDPEQFAFENIIVMQYTPRNLHTHIKSRVNSSFLFVIEGRYRYDLNKETFWVGDGEILYIPRGAEYTFTVESKNPKCIQVEFDLYRRSEGANEPLCFFDSPTKLDSTKEAQELFLELANSSWKNSFMTLSNLYRMLALFFGNTDYTFANNTERKKIFPALNHINKTPRYSVSVTELAKMCDLSPSHFRRIFKSLMGRSPIKYKNQLLISHACKMLDNGNMNVSEISSALGFSDIYTFSQIFKKEVGVPPSQYTKSKI